MTRRAAKKAAPVDPVAERARARAGLAFVAWLEKERRIVRCPGCGRAGSLVQLPATCSCGCVGSRSWAEVWCSWCERVSVRLPDVLVDGRAVRAWASRPMDAKVERSADDAAQEGC